MHQFYRQETDSETVGSAMSLDCPFQNGRTFACIEADKPDAATQARLRKPAYSVHPFAPAPPECKRAASAPCLIARIPMKRLSLAALLLAVLPFVPLTGHAAALDDALTCKESAHDFVSGLIDQKLIDDKPMRVEKNSINAFWPAHGEHLTAYGYSVFAIVAFQQDDPLFKKGDGKPIARSAYGAVVVGTTAKVQAALDAVGNTAIVHHAGPLLTAIFCQQD
ncbi:hypothetical protein [Paraburkholderia bannensis]|uniref:hypothetical protein n=1 Tax=Paraburkholderia bannensis TaxID=765414 RepID=UPI002ADE4FB1|nr:hypothetical protein [Paraburkholderia bannensis]